jgi:hypothetical protein
MLDPCILNTVLDSLSFGILEFHLRMRHICRPNVYNYHYYHLPVSGRNSTEQVDQYNQSLVCEYNFA